MVKQIKSPFCPKCFKLVSKRIKYLEALQKKHEDHIRATIISQLYWLRDGWEEGWKKEN